MTKEQFIVKLEGMVERWPNLKGNEDMLETVKSLKTEEEWEVWWNSYCNGVFGHNSHIS